MTVEISFSSLARIADHILPHSRLSIKRLLLTSISSCFRDIGDTSFTFCVIDVIGHVTI